MAKKRYYGFYADVLAELDFTYSKSYICMVKCGQRSNDDVLMAIIKADHKHKNKTHG